MAKLRCEDSELETSFEIIPEPSKDGDWQKYQIIFNLDDERQVYKSNEKDLIVGQFVFALKPENRIELFIEQIESFIKNEKQKELVFEPADPSFELVIKRSHQEGFQVYLWIDCGNTKQLRYTWDARGIRFFTTKEFINQFINELKKEFINMPSASLSET